MKKKYYVDIVNGGISESKLDGTGAFVIQADEGDLNRVQERLDNMHGAAQDTFIKSHIPYYPELNNKENARYDGNLKDLYALLYELGDEHAKEHIRSIGILDAPGNDLV